MDDGRPTPTEVGPARDTSYILLFHGLLLVSNPDTRFQFFFFILLPSKPYYIKSSLLLSRKRCVRITIILLRFITKASKQINHFFQRTTDIITGLAVISLPGLKTIIV